MKHLFLSFFLLFFMIGCSSSNNESEDLAELDDQLSEDEMITRIAHSNVKNIPDDEDLDADDDDEDDDDEEDKDDEDEKDEMAKVENIEKEVKKEEAPEGIFALANVTDDLEDEDEEDEEDKEDETQAITAVKSPEGSVYDDTNKNISKVSGKNGKYTVMPHDTLMFVAFKLYGNYERWHELAKQNPQLTAADNYQLTPGEKISYNPPASTFEWNQKGTPYLIIHGDTLGRISNKVYQSPHYWKDIWENNRPMIKNPNLIFAGFTIYYKPKNSLLSMY